VRWRDESACGHRGAVRVPPVTLRTGLFQSLKSRGRGASRRVSDASAVALGTGGGGRLPGQPADPDLRGARAIRGWRCRRHRWTWTRVRWGRRGTCA